MNAEFDIKNTQIETERLILRPWKESDLDDFYEYAKVDGVGQMAGWAPHQSIDDTKFVLDMFINEKKTFAIVLKENMKVIGSLGVENLQNELGEEYEELKGREIGYVLSKDYWGHGLMPEAVKAVMNYLINTLKMDFLVICHSLTNAQSKSVILKCGFTYIKEDVRDTLISKDVPMSFYVCRR